MFLFPLRAWSDCRAKLAANTSPQGPAEDEEQEEEEDDLAIAFEVLDMARVCYHKLLTNATEESQNGNGKGKEPESAAQDSPSVRHIKERLADTHDCLAEISLENERYPNAIEDGRTSLQYKTELYPEESEILAEAHYKLSLALEFASVTTSGDDGGPAKREDMDQGLRDEAVKEMELAIKSFKLKMQNKEVELATMASPEDNDLARKGIQEMKEVIADMEQRVILQPPSFFPDHPHKIPSIANVNPLSSSSTSATIPSTRRRSSARTPTRSGASSAPPSASPPRTRRPASRRRRRRPPT